MTRSPGRPDSRPEVLVLEAAAVLLLFGLSLVVAAVAGLAGLWWALFAAGIALAALAVLLARGPRRLHPADAPQGAAEGPDGQAAS